MNNKRRFFKVSFTFIITAGLIVFIKALALAAAADVQGTAVVPDGHRVMIAYAAMGSVGLSCITSAYALAKIGSAAMGAMSEKPEIGGRALIFLGMAEGIAIYGLIIAIMLINKI
ncbi:MAG TPA: ATP synthase subunit C [Spirochaetota bacterium]|nr:ATP synthase subunit C [Spirochaetota bacterium]